MTAEQELPTESRRRGGREARRALRAAPLAEDIKPIRPGMEGGTYKALDEAGIQRIHAAALDALEQIGLGQPIPSCVEYCEAAGAKLGDDGRLRFPRAMIEDTLAKAGRGFTLYGRDEAFDIHPGGTRVHYGTAGAATMMVDVAEPGYRNATVKDMYDAARIVEVLDNVHFFQRPMTPCDVEDLLELDINTLYPALAGTRKHVGCSFTVGENMETVFDLLHQVAGSEAAWRERPFVSNSNCFVVPPMKFAEDACRVLEACVHGGMPVLLLSAGQAGATAPPALAGAVVQATAEVLGGLAYVNAIKPGAPAIFGTWPFVSDLRTGSMSGGSGEQALLSAACAQMAQFYDLPGGAAAGMADSKLPDMQAGWEKGISNVMAGLSGLNMVYEAAGMHASLLGFCFETLILDNDLIGQCQRCVRGIEVTEDSVSLEVIRNVCTEGPGHYLGHEATLTLMQRDYVYPEIGDRTSPKEWVEKGKPDLVETASARKREILEGAHPRHISSELDGRLREQFPIKLRRAEMGW
ncbi:MAG: trimethylamine methyltransferase family protein [Limibacillus sp.]|jgi:trimethylamine--corrinoid protein Co-methyltransferase